jgi:hypothetical protein
VLIGGDIADVFADVFADGQRSGVGHIDSLALPAGNA